MPPKSRNGLKHCTCWKFCKGGNDILLRTYQDHGEQHQLKQQMMPEQRFVTSKFLSLSHGFSEDELESLRNPSCEPPDVSDPDVLLSIRQYLTCVDASEKVYENTVKNILERYPDSKMLSYDRVRRKVKRLSGVFPLIHHMCPFETLRQCNYCGESRYEANNDSDDSDSDELLVPRQTFTTIPISPQLQALIYCGSDYIELVHFLIYSGDGCQLYVNKESGAYVAVFLLGDIEGDIRYHKSRVLPAFIVGGPNAPKHIISFMFPTFHHLGACQNEGLCLWDGLFRKLEVSHPLLGYGIADTVGMQGLSSGVGHLGKYGCRLLCSFPGRCKADGHTYYPVLLKATQQLAAGKTGLTQQSIVSGLSQALPVPKCFPADTMHLFGQNMGALLLALWRGTMRHSKSDKPSNWRFAVLTGDTWIEHGHAVTDARKYLPVCLESHAPRNPVEKLSSGYKSSEWNIYLYGLCPGLLYGVLPEPFYSNFCKLVHGFHVVHQRSRDYSILAEAHEHLLQFLAQWTMECAIGNLGQEIQQHSNPFANLSQRAVLRAQINALKAMIPDLEPEKSELPSGALDLSDGYALLRSRELYVFEPNLLAASKTFASDHGKILGRHDITVDRWARLRLGNGQITRSAWKELHRPVEKVRRARNVKVSSQHNHQLDIIDHIIQLHHLGATRFAEVLFYFQAALFSGGEIFTLAAISMYSMEDRDLFELSHGVLRVCQYHGDDGIVIVEAKSITEVIAMASLACWEGLAQTVENDNDGDEY
ncbi:hypothetical protein C8J56DRAFT_1000189 [Mycena floridula]|nr:hypothetical protein C8J56DRAFT_1000189 [Mycena floridula]